MNGGRMKIGKMPYMGIGPIGGGPGPMGGAMMGKTPYMGITPWGGAMMGKIPYMTCPP
jgi:hypothetical protein